jgi:uncharacterized protein YecE (DUF72 family)
MAKASGTAEKATVRVGTAGWTDPTLIKSGRFYPPGTNSAEARLRYYASQFPIVEVDASYYYLPTDQQAGLWVERTPPEFVFNVKAFSLLTGHPTRRNALPKDLEGELDPNKRDAQRLYATHLSADALTEVWRRFHEALLPLDSAGKLGAVLLQYPEWFGPRRSSREELRRARERLPGYQVCVELRNRAWLEEGSSRDRTLSFLAEENLPLVCVDMPQGFRSSVPPLAAVTSPDLAVVRFHGRDPKAWAHKGPTAGPRFRYLYKEDELEEWVPRVERLAEGARDVHVVMNNCVEDFAVRNARQLAGLLHQDAGAPPNVVVQPELASS